MLGERVEGRRLSVSSRGVQSRVFRAPITVAGFCNSARPCFPVGFGFGNLASLPSNSAVVCLARLILGSVTFI